MRKFFLYFSLVLFFSGCATILPWKKSDISKQKKTGFLQKEKEIEKIKNNDDLYVGEAIVQIKTTSEDAIERAKERAREELAKTIKVKVEKTIEDIIGKNARKSYELFESKTKSYSKAVLTDIPPGKYFLDYPTAKSVTYLLWVSKEKYEENVKKDIETRLVSVRKIYEMAKKSEEIDDFIAAKKGYGKVIEMCHDIGIATVSADATSELEKILIVSESNLLKISMKAADDFQKKGKFYEALETYFELYGKAKESSPEILPEIESKVKEILQKVSAKIESIFIECIKSVNSLTVETYVREKTQKKILSGIPLEFTVEKGKGLLNSTLSQEGAKEYINLLTDRDGIAQCFVISPPDEAVTISVKPDLRGYLGGELLILLEANIKLVEEMEILYLAENLNKFVKEKTLTHTWYPETATKQEEPYDFVEKWRKDWEGGINSFEEYSNCYSEDFRSDKGENILAWRQKKRKFTSRNIEVKITEFRKKELQNNQVEITFTQHYVSGEQSDLGEKTLRIKPDGVSWKIYFEGWTPLKESTVNKEESMTSFQGSSSFTDEYEIKEFLQDWKSSWEKSFTSDADFNKYISCYSENFTTQKKGRSMNLNDWRSYKQGLSRKYSWIKIEIENIKIKPSQDSMRVKFNQTYRSSGYSDKSQKILHLMKESGKWKITYEYAE